MVVPNKMQVKVTVIIACVVAENGLKVYECMFALKIYIHKNTLMSTNLAEQLSFASVGGFTKTKLNHRCFLGFFPKFSEQQLPGTLIAYWLRLR